MSGTRIGFSDKRMSPATGNQIPADFELLGLDNRDATEFPARHR